MPYDKDESTCVMDGSLVQSLADSSRIDVGEAERAVTIEAEAEEAAPEELFAVEVPTRVMSDALVEQLAERTRQEPSAAAPAPTPAPTPTPEPAAAPATEPVAALAAPEAPIPDVDFDAPDVRVGRLVADIAAPAPPPPREHAWRGWVAAIVLAGVAGSAVALVVFPDRAPRAFATLLHLDRIAAPDPPTAPTPAPPTAEPAADSVAAANSVAAPAPEPAVAAAPAAAAAAVADPATVADPAAVAADPAAVAEPVAVVDPAPRRTSPAHRKHARATRAAAATP